MKNILIISIIISSLSLNAQFFREAFDRQDNTINNGNGASIESYWDPNFWNPNTNDYGGYNGEVGNGFGTYQTLSGPVLCSYLRMYRATDDIYYLNKALVQIKNIQDHRDDLMQPYNEGDTFTYKGYTFTPGSSTSRPDNPTWSIYGFIYSSKPWYASVVYSGEIIFPMADLIYLVREEQPSLLSLDLPQNSVFNNISCDGNTDLTIENFACWLEARLKETIEFHERQPVVSDNFTYDYWNNGYKNPNGNSVDCNFSTAMGRAMVMLYLASDDASLKALCLGHINQIKQNLFNIWDLTYEDDHYEWKHREGNDDDDYEEVSHGAMTAHFAYLCNKYGFTSIFSDQDIEKFKNTFTRSIYYQPRKLLNSVVGDNTSCPSCTTDYKYIYKASEWLPFSTMTGATSYEDYVGRDIYQIISELTFLRLQSYPNGENATCQTINALSNLVYYKDIVNASAIFNPLSINTEPGSGSNWEGVEGGNLDNDDDIEYVAVRNSTLNSKILIYELNSSNAITYVTGINPGNYEFEDVATGDFDGDNTDEFITITNQYGNFYIYELDQGSISLMTSYTAPHQDSDWQGVAAGNFDSDANDEFVAIRNYSDKKLYLYEYDNINNQIVGVSSCMPPNSSVTWACLTSGDFDGDGIKNEIIAVDNNQGNFYVYKITNGVFELKATYSDPNPASNWTDITAGDYDNDGIDEFIAHRNLDGDMYLYKIDIQSGVYTVECKGQEFFTAGQLIDILGSGDFDSDGKEDLVCLRNIDGTMIMYSLEGICPGLDISTDNISIDSDEYGVRDYHVKNNIATKGNCIIETGNSVQFIAGNSITLKTGFQAESGSSFIAKIDQTGDLACGADPVIKRAPGTEYYQNDIHELSIKHGSSTIYPNPTNSKINIRIDETEGNFSYSVSNLVGKTLINESTDENLISIDMTAYPKGIYIVKISDGINIKTEKIIYQ